MSSELPDCNSWHPRAPRDSTVSLDPNETVNWFGSLATMPEDDLSDRRSLVSYRLAENDFIPKRLQSGCKQAVVSALANFPHIGRRTFVAPGLQVVASADPNLVQQ